MKELFLACLLTVSASMAYAHTLDSVEEYRLEMQWEIEPPYSGEINAIKLYVSPLVLGLDLEEQPFQNGVAGLEDTLKIQLANKDHTITLLLEDDDQIPGLYRAYVKVLRPGFYQANILGHIGDLPVSLSMHPHEIRDAGHINFPDGYGDIYEIRTTQDEIRSGVQAAASARADLNGVVQVLESQVREMSESIYLAALPGVAGIILGAVAVYAARRRH